MEAERYPLTGGAKPPNYASVGDDVECASPTVPFSKEKSREVTALRIAVVFCFCFMLAEIVGGYLAHSLAILTDAAHLLTDVGAFCLSLFAIHASQRGSDHRYSYGFHRAEVLGTMASVFTIWALVGAIVVEALGRIRVMARCAEIRPLHLSSSLDAVRHKQHHTNIPGLEFTECVAVESSTMIIIGALGLIVNVLCAVILSWGGSHGHSHSFGDDHGHSHDDHGHSHDDHGHSHDDHEDSHDDHGHSHDDHGHSHDDHGHSHDDHGHSHDDHGHSHGDGNDERGPDLHGPRQERSIALNAAFLHALGDSVQSVGVVLAGVFIYVANQRTFGTPTDPYSYYNLADPACSLLFAGVTLFMTRKIIGQLVGILMESTPDGVDYAALRSELMALPNVEAVHDLHIWSLTAGKAALSVHMVASDHTGVLAAARDVCQRHSVDHCTIQVDPPGADAEKCVTSLGCHNC